MKHPCDPRLIPKISSCDLSVSSALSAVDPIAFFSIRLAAAGFVVEGCFGEAPKPTREVACAPQSKIRVIRG
jgi:hypothetical protein